MKTQIFAVALLISGSVYAQNQVTIQGAQTAPQGAAVKYDEATNTVVEVQPATVVETRANPIVILNNQRLQEQPPTVVEASPLTESQADRMRKQRQGLEVNTEQRIVEKLEEARMEDERARADRLFGNGFTKPAPAPAPAPVMVQEPVPVVVAPQAPVQPVVVAPAPQVVEVAKEDKVDVRSEIRLAMEELNQKPKPKQSYYIGALVGLSEYQDAQNVNGNLATGVSVGTVTEDHIVLEGQFLYSQYQVDDYTQVVYPWKELEQYGLQAAVKYQLLTGKLRPFAGAVLGYTHRSATNRQLYAQNGWGGVATNEPPPGEGTSMAIDAGLTAGLDLAVSSGFSLGGEARYMTNVASKREFGNWNDWEANNGITPIEEMDYYTISVNGKFTF
jgi:hypothetical protein